jgi:hypothetical protein
MKHITESEFRAYARQRRQALAQAVADSGLTIAEIATGTRMNRKTVAKIAQAQVVRNESQDRVRCYLEAVNTNEK